MRTLLVLVLCSLFGIASADIRTENIYDARTTLATTGAVYEVYGSNKTLSVSISGTATVNYYGSNLLDSGAFVLIASITSSQTNTNTAAYRYIRVDIDVCTGCTVWARLGVEQPVGRPLQEDPVLAEGEL